MTLHRVSLNQLPIPARTFRRLMDDQLKEAAWQKQVERALDAHGWWWSHNPPNVVVCPRCRIRIFRGIRKGIPDIWAIKPPYMLWIELKASSGSLDRHQRMVRDLIEACGLVFIQARPKDRERLLDWIVNPEKARTRL